MRTKKQKSFKMMFSCGAENFDRMDGDDQDPPAKPKSCKRKRSKNPYAARGLDKFSTVLAELEAKREMILAKTGSPGVALIRFVYHNSQDWVPIIVRPKTAQKLRAVGKTEINQEEAHVEEKAEEGKKVVKRSSSWNVREGWMGWRDSCYWPSVMVLVLLCLAVFGRMFATCCVCIWWYMIPSDNILKERSMLIKKKDYGRRLSDKRLLGGKKG